MSKLICPHCGKEITDRIGTAVEEYGYSDKDGVFYGNEYGDTLYHWCYECGEKLPQEIVDKFYEENKNV